MEAMIQHWHDVLYHAGYTRDPCGGFISPKGDHYSDDKIAELFKMAIGRNPNPYMQASMQAQAYNAQNNAIHPYQNPQNVFANVPNPVYASGVQTPVFSLPPMTGRVVHMIFKDVAGNQTILHVDEAYVPILDYISVQCMSGTGEACKAATYTEVDFSLDEIEKGEDIIHGLQAEP
jgi:hypothetical protein